MTNSTTALLGCRECGGIEMHERTCSLTHRYDFRTPVLDSERLPTPERHEFRTVTRNFPMNFCTFVKANASRCGLAPDAAIHHERHMFVGGRGDGKCQAVLKGGWPCSQPADAEVHAVVERSAHNCPACNKECPCLDGAANVDECLHCDGTPADVEVHAAPTNIRSHESYCGLPADHEGECTAVVTRLLVPASNASPLRDQETVAPNENHGTHVCVDGDTSLGQKSVRAICRNAAPDEPSEVEKALAELRAMFPVAATIEVRVDAHARYFADYPGEKESGYRYALIDVDGNKFRADALAIALQTVRDWKENQK